MSNYKACYDEKPRPPQPDQYPVTILCCGNGAGGSLPVTSGIADGRAAHSVGGISSNVPILTVATINLDTKGLCQPNIKIDFSGMLNFKAHLLHGYDFRIVFQLSRTCDHGTKVSLATWTYERQIDLCLEGMSIPSQVIYSEEIKEPFNFVWSQGNQCAECCVYAIEIIDICAYYVECASITNVAITGLISGKQRCW